MAEPKRQLKIETSEQFYQLVQDEKTKRDLTLHALVMRALERYLAVPEDTHRGIEHHAERVGDSIREVSRRAWDTLHFSLRGKRRRRKTVPPPGLLELLHDLPGPEQVELLSTLWEYMRDFPPEKLRLLKESLALDLKYYRSARIKGEPQENPWGYSRGPQ